MTDRVNSVSEGPLATKSTASDVLVIGAGVAGLAAAREISASGLSVIVLEARDRIGGRIFTIRDNNSAVPIELGAEFVHGRPPETLAVAHDALLMLCEVPERHWQMCKGLLIKSAQFWSELEAIMNKMKRLRKRDLSFKAFLDEYCRKASDETKTVATMFIEGFHASRTDIISVTSLIRSNEAEDQIDGDKQFRILSGYDRIPEWLAHQAVSNGTRIQLNTTVQEARWKRHYVEVTVETRSEIRSYQASRMVITLPLGLMQAPSTVAGAVRFIPELSEKENAARSLMMGHVIKVTLRFREAFWEQHQLPAKEGPQSLMDLCFIHSATEAVPTWWTQLPVRVPVLVGWAGGPAAEELGQRDEQIIIDRALSSLSSIVAIPKSRIADLLDAAYAHNWNRDPFTRGAYSYVPSGGLNAQAELAQPVGDTLFFAGEATNTEGHNGTVHGAIATGLRAASEVIGSARARHTIG